MSLALMSPVQHIATFRVSIVLVESFFLPHEEKKHQLDFMFLKVLFVSIQNVKNQQFWRCIRDIYVEISAEGSMLTSEQWPVLSHNGTLYKADRSSSSFSWEMFSSNQIALIALRSPKMKRKKYSCTYFPSDTYKHNRTYSRFTKTRKNMLNCLINSL